MFNEKITPLDNASGGQTLTDGDRFYFKSRVFHSSTLSIDSNFEIIFSRYSSDGITSIYIKKCINNIIGTNTNVGRSIRCVLHEQSVRRHFIQVSKYRVLEQFVWLTHY